MLIFSYLGVISDRYDAFCGEKTQGIDLPPFLFLASDVQ